MPRGFEGEKGGTDVTRIKIYYGTEEHNDDSRIVGVK